MTGPTPTVALFARYPVPGEAKTRLIPALGAEGAASLHRRLVMRTLAVMQTSGLPHTMWTTGAPHSTFAKWLGEDVPFVEQGEGDLGARLARVPAPCILLGADIPDLSVDHLKKAAAALAHVPIVLGPAGDGGYYLLGLAHPMPWLFTDMDWGSENVFGDTLRRITNRGEDYHLLDHLDDCDRPEDLERWPHLVR